MYLLLGFAWFGVLAATPGGRRPKGVAARGGAAGQACRLRYEPRKRAHRLPSSRRSTSMRAPRNPARTSVRGMAQV